MTPGDSRASVLAALSERRPELLGQAFAATLAITVDVTRERRFAELEALIGRLPESERRAALTEALATSQVISDQSGLSCILATFARRLPEQERRAALAEALAAARAITAEDDRAVALAGLAVAVPADMVEHVLQAARDIADPGNRAQVYAVLAWRLPESECDAVFAEAIEAVFASGQRAGDGALEELARRLPQDLVDPAFRAAFRIEDDYCCSKMLIELARRLGPASPADAAFTPAPEVLGEPTGLARTRSVLAGRLPATPGEWQAGFARALQVALIRYNIPHNRARVLVALVQRMPGTLLDSALDAARSIAGEYGAAGMLAEVALRRPEADRGALFGEALEMAGALSDGRDRAWQYEWLADLLPTAEQAPVVSEGLEAARTTEGYTRVDTLGQLIGKLPGGADEALSAEALEAARAITDGSDRAWALMELAGRLPASEQRPVFAEAIDAALTLADGYQHVRALRGLVRQVPDEIRIDSYAAWTSLLDDAAIAPRPLLWSPSGEWAVRLIDDLAGPAAVREAWQWVSRAARWWP
jgi:hypothetical protein